MTAVALELKLRPRRLLQDLYFETQALLRNRVSARLCLAPAHIAVESMQMRVDE